MLSEAAYPTQLGRARHETRPEHGDAATSPRGNTGSVEGCVHCGRALAEQPRISQRVPHMSPARPESVAALLNTLADARLVAPERRQQALFAAERVLGRGACIEADTSAHVLHAVANPSDGVVSHDFAFWSETDDVIAEFSVALGSVSASFEQVAIAEHESLTVCTRTRASVQSIEIELVPGGLDAVVLALNAVLAEAGCERRMVALETNELDWKVYVSADGDLAAQLSTLGQTRALRPR